MPTSRMVPALSLVVALGCPADDGGGDEGAGTTADTGGATTMVVASESTGAAMTESTGAPLPTVDYATDIQPIWNAACTCHLQGPSGTMTATTLTLNEGMSYGELVGLTSTQAPLARIEPSDLEGSYLWHKLHGTHLEAGGSGTPMPQVGVLSDEQLTAIEAWIVSGAAS